MRLRNSSPPEVRFPRATRKELDGAGGIHLGPINQNHSIDSGYNQYVVDGRIF
jgi:hypothetical protein